MTKYCKYVTVKCIQKVKPYLKEKIRYQVFTDNLKLTSQELRKVKLELISPYWDVKIVKEDNWVFKI